MSDQKQDGLFTCSNICWAIAVVIGFAAFRIAVSSLGFNAFGSMLVGIIVFFAAGSLLGKYVCTEAEKTEEAATPVPAPAPTPAPKTPEPVAPVADVEATPAPVAETAPESVVKSSILPGEQELADRKGTYKYEPVETKTAVKKPAAKKTAAKKPAAKATKAKAETAPAQTEAAVEKKPRTMKAARKAGADDLKLLKGVGPKLEQTLNELGFYHFDQVAKWGTQEIAWVDARLKFKGRIERDGWIDQAKILADGGETEFSKRGKKA